MFMYSSKIQKRKNKNGETEYTVRISPNKRKVFTDPLEAKEYLSSNEYLLYRDLSKERNIASWSINVGLFISFILGIASIVLTINKSQVVNKKEITTSIREVIRNNGNIDNIKHIYNSRTIENKYSPSLKDFYSNETSLSYILNDIIIEEYKSVDKDSVLINKLNKMLKEYEIINPFDKLENTQVYSFNNIKMKLDSNYVKIQPDINKIVDELANKNQLVSTYLNKSDISFYISVFALFVTFIFSLYQIYQAKQSSKEINKIEQIFVNLLDHQNKDENNKS